MVVRLGSRNLSARFNWGRCESRMSQELARERRCVGLRGRFGGGDNKRVGLDSKIGGCGRIGLGGEVVGGSRRVGLGRKFGAGDLTGNRTRASSFSHVHS